MKSGYGPAEAAEVLGSKVLLAECIAARWIKPKVQRHTLTPYDFSEIAAACEPNRGGEMPPPLRRKNPRKPATAKEVVHV